MSARGVRGGRFREETKCSRRMKPKSGTSAARPSIDPRIRPAGSDAALAPLAVTVTLCRTSIVIACPRESATHTGCDFGDGGSANKIAGNARATIPLHGHNAKTAIAAAYARALRSLRSSHKAATIITTHNIVIE